MNTIYCVVVDTVYDYDESTRIVAAFTILEYALERMRNEWKQFLKEDWSAKLDMREEGRMCCAAWQDGWASCYHHYIRVEEVDLHE